jgi:peptide-methionine (R)-S-oxide reductase
MNRLKQYLKILPVFLFVACGNAQKTESTEKNSEPKEYKVSKTNDEWRELLSSEEFQVLRKAGTERPFTSPLNNEKRAGTLICAACYAPLYKNENKFDSGTGWPSYDQAIEGQVEKDVDYKIGYARTEAKCNTCGSHLGHIFDDGPRKTTGKRHCINGVALDFVPEGEQLPELRK